MKRSFSILKTALFGFIVVMGLFVSSKVFTPKFYQDDTWATTCTYHEFYELPENSVDLIFLGSSRGASDFDPRLLEETGISAYNLCCEQQNLATSFFWLEEAFRYQSPKIVVVETNYLYLNREKDGNLFNEGSLRKALDSMQWSKTKLAAVQYICQVDDYNDLFSFIFPITRFHDRWKELSVKDVAVVRAGTRGYAPFTEQVDPERTYEPYSCEVADLAVSDLDENLVNKKESEVKKGEETQDVMQAGMDSEMEYFLNRIKSYCDEKGAELILVTGLSDEENPGKHLTNEAYASENGISYLDFNERKNYEAAGLDFYQDNSSGNHGNVSGSRKMTEFLGSIIE